MWTYDPTDLGKHLNWIRLRIGDTDTNDQQISDEEIQGCLDRDSRREFAAAMVADLIAAKYTRLGANAERETYHTLASEIRKEATPSYL